MGVRHEFYPFMIDTCRVALKQVFEPERKRHYRHNPPSKAKVQPPAQPPAGPRSPVPTPKQLLAEGSSEAHAHGRTQLTLHAQPAPSHGTTSSPRRHRRSPEAEPEVRCGIQHLLNA